MLSHQCLHWVMSLQRAHPYRTSSFVIVSRRKFRLNSWCDWFRGDETSGPRAWLSSLCSATVLNRGRFDNVESSHRSGLLDLRRRRFVGLDGCLSHVLSHRSRCCKRNCWCWSDKLIHGCRSRDRKLLVQERETQQQEQVDHVPPRQKAHSTTGAVTGAGSAGRSGSSSTSSTVSAKVTRSATGTGAGYTSGAGATVWVEASAWATRRKPSPPRCDAIRTASRHSWNRIRASALRRLSRRP